MKILYVAKHDSGDNDDEGAITDALRNLGHEVIRVHEKPKHRPKELRTVAQMNLLNADLCLFHKWPNTEEINKVRAKKKALWYFDLVASNDPLLTERSKTRIEWFSKIEQSMDRIFCTDGDWVGYQNFYQYMKGMPKTDNDKLRYCWLMQGADQRKCGRGLIDPNLKYPPILFAGMVNHGSVRVKQIDYLKEKLGDKLWLLGDGGPKYRKHGRELADIVANVKVVLCPAGPVTNYYWSNRIYQMGGFGGFILHPFTSGLKTYYTMGKHYMSYDPDDYTTLVKTLEEFIADGYREERERMSEMILRHTVENNTYQNRVKELLENLDTKE